MEGSTDLKYARLVANWIKSDHPEISSSKISLKRFLMLSVLSDICWCDLGGESFGRKLVHLQKNQGTIDIRLFLMAMVVIKSLVTIYTSIMLHPIRI
jgi:hypothetical protein